LFDPCDCKSGDGKEATGQQLFALTPFQVTPTFEYWAGVTRKIITEN